MHTGELFTKNCIFRFGRQLKHFLFSRGLDIIVIVFDDALVYACPNDSKKLDDFDRGSRFSVTGSLNSQTEGLRPFGLRESVRYAPLSILAGIM